MSDSPPLSPHLEQVLRGLGLYRVIAQANTCFGSIVYRMLAGVLGYFFPEALALDTAIEFFLNAALEIPFGKLADRFGKAKCAKVGILLYAVSSVICFLAIQFSAYPSFTLSLIIVNGVFLGLATPLVSGSIEGFYQEAAQRAEVKGNTIQHAFALSEKYGKYIPITATASAIVLLIKAYRSGWAPYLFLIVSVGWLYLWWHVHSNQKEFTELRRNHPPAGKPASSVISIASSLWQNKVFRGANITLICITGIRCVVMGYLLVSLGRDLRINPARNYWWVLTSFMVGHFGIGWLLKGYLVPYMSHSKLANLWHLFLSLLLVATALAGGLEWKSMTENSLFIFVMFFAVVFQITISAIQADCTDQLLRNSNPSDYATTLSISNMPGYFFIGGYSGYLAIFRNGAPSSSEAFLTIAVIAFALLGSLLTRERESSDNLKKLVFPR